MSHGHIEEAGRTRENVVRAGWLPVLIVAAVMLFVPLAAAGHAPNYMVRDAFVGTTGGWTADDGSSPLGSDIDSANGKYGKTTESGRSFTISVADVPSEYEATGIVEKAEVILRQAILSAADSVDDVFTLRVFGDDDGDGILSLLAQTDVPGSTSPQWRFLNLFNARPDIEWTPAVLNTLQIRVTSKQVGAESDGTWGVDRVALKAWINRPPEAHAATTTTAEDTAVTDLLSVDEFDAGDSLVFEITDFPTKGAITSFDAGTGEFTYEPSLNVNSDVDGDDSFDYEVTDEYGEMSTATQTIQITAVNDAPVANDDGGSAYTTNEDTPLTVAPPGVLDNDVDVEDDPLEAVVTVPPATGTLDWNAANDGGFTYTPAPDESGAVTFEYRVQETSGLQGSEATVTIIINPVDDGAPTAAPHTFSGTEDTPITEAAGTLMVGSTNPDGNPLEAKWFAGPLHGTVEVFADGGFHYVPAADIFGPAADSFQYVLSDGDLDSGPATVTLDLEGTEDPLVVTSGTFTGLEGQTVPGSLADYVINVDEDALEFEITDVGAAGTATLLDGTTGAFDYRAFGNTVGHDTFFFRARVAGDSTWSPEFDVDVTILRQLAVDEDTPTEGSMKSFMDGPPSGLTYTITSPPSSGHVLVTDAVSGAFVYVPGSNSHGEDTFFFEVHAGSTLRNSGGVQLIVGDDGPDSPVADNDGDGVPNGVEFAAASDAERGHETPFDLVHDNFVVNGGFEEAIAGWLPVTGSLDAPTPDPTVLTYLDVVAGGQDTGAAVRIEQASDDAGARLMQVYSADGLPAGITGGAFLVVDVLEIVGDAPSVSVCYDGDDCGNGIGALNAPLEHGRNRIYLSDTVAAHLRSINLEAGSGAGSSATFDNVHIEMAAAEETALPGVLAPVGAASYAEISFALNGAGDQLQVTVEALSPGGVPTADAFECVAFDGEHRALPGGLYDIGPSPPDALYFEAYCYQVSDPTATIISGEGIFAFT